MGLRWSHSSIGGTGGEGGPSPNIGGDGGEGEGPIVERYFLEGGTHDISGRPVEYFRHGGSDCYDFEAERVAEVAVATNEAGLVG